jgi:hypothetical protein
VLASRGEPNAPRSSAPDLARTSGLARAARADAHARVRAASVGIAFFGLATAISIAFAVLA